MVENFFSFLSSFLWKLVKGGRVVTAILIIAIVAAIYAATPSMYDKYVSPMLSAVHEKAMAADKEPNLFKDTVYLWTYDSTDDSIQHKQITLKGWTTFHGRYFYRESNNGGVISGYRRIGQGTIGLEYGSNDPDGNGLGYITLRQLKSPVDTDPPVWIGFEMGHDCLCGSKVPHEGSFTSVPAILTTTPEPPEYLVNLVKRAKAQKANFVWPSDIVEQMKGS